MKEFQYQGSSELQTGNYRQLKTVIVMSTKKKSYLFLFLLEERCRESELRVKNVLSVQTCQAFVNSVTVNKTKKSILAQNYELKPNPSISTWILILRKCSMWSIHGEKKKILQINYELFSQLFFRTPSDVLWCLQVSFALNIKYYHILKFNDQVIKVLQRICEY